jgi:hypothetical protein
MIVRPQFESKMKVLAPSDPDPSFYYVSSRDNHRRGRATRAEGEDDRFEAERSVFPEKANFVSFTSPADFAPEKSLHFFRYDTEAILNTITPNIIIQVRTINCSL